jgi:hypothetical protein
MELNYLFCGDLIMPGNELDIRTVRPPINHRYFFDLGTGFRLPEVAAQKVASPGFDLGERKQKGIVIDQQCAIGGNQFPNPRDSVLIGIMSECLDQAVGCWSNLRPEFNENGLVSCG